MWSGKEDQPLTCVQEFSIEIPDKEADAIHSGTLYLKILDDGAYTNCGK